MCLAVPGRIVEWMDRDPLLARALVEFAGIRRECHLACVPEAVEGDYVLVHAGVAICRLDAQAAELLYRELAQAGELDPAWTLTSHDRAGTSHRAQDQGSAP